jgi:hypothetical protein
VLLLACGHPGAFFDEDVRAEEVSEYVWACDECGAEDQEARVLGSLTEAEALAMSDNDLEAWHDSLLLPLGAI